MKICTLQWNIGGGRICKSGANPLDPASYTEDGIGSIVELLKREAPDAKKTKDGLEDRLFISSVTRLSIQF
jgi:hypothetical protein